MGRGITPGEWQAMTKGRLDRAELDAIEEIIPTLSGLPAFEEGWWQGWTGKKLPRKAPRAFRAGWRQGKADRAASDALPEPTEEADSAA